MGRPRSTTRRRRGCASWRRARQRRRRGPAPRWRRPADRSGAFRDTSEMKNTLRSRIRRLLAALVLFLCAQAHAQGVFDEAFGEANSVVAWEVVEGDAASTT